MNRGVLQSSPVQQMVAAGNPNWWSINNMMRPPPPPPPPPSHHYQPTSPFLPPPPNIFPSYVPSSSSSSSSIPMPCWYDKQEQLPESWSQLLLCGLVVGDEDNKGVNNMGQFQAAKKLEQWEEEAQQQVLNLQVASSSPLEHVKQENSASCYVYGGHACHGHDQDFQASAAAKASGCWSHMMTDPCASSSSPNKSCVSTTFSSPSNMLDFSSNKGGGGDGRGRHPPPDRSSECDGIATGGTLKKARVQPSSTQSTFKVRKEKLGDRITALHQLVSPFGKTDTASVLLEAIGYIRFLQSQIEALSLPYLGSGSSPNNIKQSPQPVQGGGERNCIFPEDPGQLLNDNCIKRKGPSDHQDTLEEPKKDLRSRGLCLVPISCTLQVGNDNGADFWAPALGGGFR